MVCLVYTKRKLSHAPITFRGARALKGEERSNGSREANPRRRIAISRSEERNPSDQQRSPHFDVPTYLCFSSNLAISGRPYLAISGRKVSHAVSGAGARNRERLLGPGARDLYLWHGRPNSSFHDGMLSTLFFLFGTDPFATLSTMACVLRLGLHDGMLGLLRLGNLSSMSWYAGRASAF